MSSTGIDKSRSALREDVNALRDDLGVLKTDAARTVSDLASAGRGLAKEGVHMATDMAKRGGAQAENLHKAMCDFVAERPTTAILIAVGVGALLARMLSSPRR